MRPLIILVLLGNCAFCQVKISLDPEIGINNLWFTRSSKVGGGEEKRFRTPGVLGGVWITGYVNKHIFANVGFQYLHTGVKETYHRSGVRPPDNKYAVSSQRETFSFQKVSLPVSIGYSFFTKKLVLSPSLGVKSTHFLSGEYNYHMRYSEDGVVLLDYREEIDPYDKNSLHKTATKKAMDVFVSIGILFRNTASLNLSYSSSLRDIYFTEDIDNTDIDARHHYYGGELSLSIRYPIVLMKAREM